MFKRQLCYHRRQLAGAIWGIPVQTPEGHRRLPARARRAGTLELAQPSFDTLTGSLGGPDWNLNLQGWVSYGTPLTIRFQGKGDIGGETWVYDYYGFLAPAWPNGEAQRPAIVGTIVRTVPHNNGQAKAGYVASWIAVRQD